MTVLMVLVLLICTLSLGAGGRKDHQDAVHPGTTLQVDRAMIVDQAPVCRYGEGPPLQRDLSAPTPAGREAAPSPP